MQQKDYLLREIEKFGLMITMIINKLSRRKEEVSLSEQDQLEEAKGLLLQEIGFDVDVCFSLEDSEIEQYISTLQGVSGANIELLADVLHVMGKRSEPDATRVYLEKALKLYELCNSMDRTFSFDREGKIREIKDTL